MQDLEFLWVYWTGCRSSSPGCGNGLGVSEAWLDMALVKLAEKIGGWKLTAMFHGTRNLIRNIKSNRTNKEKNDKRKIFVGAIYEHGLRIEAGTKLNKACGIIRKQFEYSRGKEGPWGTIPKDPKRCLPRVLTVLNGGS